MHEDIRTLYYKCSKCGKENSQLYCHGFGEPYYDCPYCGGLLVFEPSCWTCGEFDGLSCNVVCQQFNGYRQKEMKK